jgi:hypothetical protein
LGFIQEQTPEGFPPAARSGPVEDVRFEGKTCPFIRSTNSRF